MLIRKLRARKVHNIFGSRLSFLNFTLSLSEIWALHIYAHTLTMIIDVARHKFYEGLFTLFATALTMIVFVAMGIGEDVAMPKPYSLSMPLVHDATFGSGFLEGLIIVILYAIGVLTLSRATLRTHIYPSDTMAAMALSAVMTLPMIVGGCALRETVVALYTSVALGNMLLCYGPRKSPHRLFGAMLAAGMLATVEASLMVVPLTMGIALVFARKRLREAMIVAVGMLLPLFTAFYVAWLGGEEFGECALAWWRSAYIPLELNSLDSISIPRLAFWGFVLILQIVASVLHIAQRDSLTSQRRGIWRALHLIFVVAVCAFVFMPAASGSLLTVAIITSATMLPTFFVCNGVMLSALSYVALCALAIAASLQ